MAEMDIKLALAAEMAFEKYDDVNGIVTELLFSWLLAEVHFAGTVTNIQTTTLGASPQTDLEKELMIETAKAYRFFRKGIERAERSKPTGDMYAVRLKSS
jgi:hypothetical protein